ncbi:MAG TPA: hypothetical protein VKU02_21370, partial [Gemmataceae bacterium]|nr:hypothetical protein [Gemmataceae bacterium]
MTLRSWIRKLIQPYPRFHGRRGRGGRHRQCPKRWGKPWLEVLEDRLAPATITVMNANDGPDPGPAGSLRNAIDNSTSGDTIIFSATLVGQTITLTRELIIQRNLTIIGLGANLLTVDGNHADRDFLIFGGIASIRVQIIGLTIEKGMASGEDALGGGILNFDNLTLTDCTLSGNTARGPAGGNGEGGGGGGAGAGGGIFNYGNLNLLGCTLSDNTTTGGIGGNGGKTSNGGMGGGVNGGAGSLALSTTPAGNG